MISFAAKHNDPAQKLGWGERIGYGIGGGADDNGDEYESPLGFGNGADSGMDDDGNCGG